jgi:GT2 family glycosyltransferase
MQPIPPLPQVVVAVLNWNGSQNTIPCLQHLARLDYPDVTVIVVDNGSRDDSVKHLHAAFPDIELIESGENLGYAAGNALALQRALALNADLFWILNNDALAQPDALSQLVMAYQQGGEALYGGLPVYEDGGLRLAVSLEVLDGAKKTRVESGNPVEQHFADKRKRQVKALSGASLMIPLSIVRKHGFIDPSFFLYSEETDYCLRLAQAGVPSYLVPGALALHTPRGAHKHNPLLKPVITYYQIRNRLMLAQRYHGAFAFAWTVALHLVYAFGWMILGMAQPERRVLGWHALLAVRDALMGRMGKTFAPEDYA